MSISSLLEIEAFPVASEFLNKYPLFPIAKVLRNRLVGVPEKLFVVQ
jgi:hypothetical protein